MRLSQWRVFIGNYFQARTELRVRSLSNFQQMTISGASIDEQSSTYFREKDLISKQNRIHSQFDRRHKKTTGWLDSTLVNWLLAHLILT